MNRRYWFSSGIPCLLFAVVAAVPCAAGAEDPAGLDDLSDLARKALSKSGAPGLAVAAVVDGEIRAAGVSGVRKFGDKTVGDVEIGDRFHIGSLTKSFTATLAAALEEEGRIRWDSKPAETFRIPKLHPGFRDLTLEHLLSNRGGFPGVVPDPIWTDAWAARGNPVSLRLDFARTMLAREPLFAPGEDHTYSNTGFSIAGVMLESRAGESWESLIWKRIIVPLKMTSAGFRAPAADPGRPGEVRKQPWGHRPNRGPVPPEPFGDNPVVIAPANTLHCSIVDLAKYARFHLLKKPEPVFKKAETFETLFTSRGDHYALGWAVTEREWAGGETITHNGTNTMFYAVIWIAPLMDFAVVAATNIGGDTGAAACDLVVWSTIERYVLAKKPR